MKKRSNLLTLNDNTSITNVWFFITFSQFTTFLPFKLLAEKVVRALLRKGCDIRRNVGNCRAMWFKLS